MHLAFWKTSSHHAVETETPAGLLNTASIDGVRDDLTHSNTGDPGTASPDKEKGSIAGVGWRAWDLTRLWIDHVCPEIPFNARGDHLSNEQTFIAWFSTAEAVSVMGVVVAQVSQIEEILDADEETGGSYGVLAISQGCVCQVLAIMILVIGACRFFEAQRVFFSPERTRFSPWGVYLVAILILIDLVALFVLKICYGSWGSGDVPLTG